ncbi:MAG TPA: hypothetical protein PLL76_16200 [Thermoanaerobaculia bacterium]|nr:hypothetical protein [Thermoanaerobaculia bacterium]
MKPASKPQYASVEQPFGCQPPKPHCPVCGKAVLQVDDDGLAHADPCPHLAFIFVGEAGEFEYRSPAFEKKAARRRLNDLDLVKLRKLLERIGYGNKLLALEVTYGGMACGPVWYTDVYGFDYETVEDDEEAEEVELCGSKAPDADPVQKVDMAG